MGGHSQWENVAIQEGFKTQEGLRIGGHDLHIASQMMLGKLRCLATLLHSKVDRSAYIPVRRHKVARKIIVDEAHNAICTSAAQCVQDQCRKANIFSKQTKRGNTAGHGLHCGPGRSSGQRLGRNGCGWQSGDAQERTARPSGRIHGGSLLACNTQPNAEHEELIDVYSTLVGWRSSRPNRLYFGFTRLVSPRHTAGSAHLQQNGPQTGHSRGGQKTERWRDSTPHKETTKPPALGGRGRLERNNRKTLV